MSKVVITGSTGYVGSRLIKVLGDTKHSLVCIARNKKYLENKLPSNASVIELDFSKKIKEIDPFQNAKVAFFLMHSLGEKKAFEKIESSVAQNFVSAAKASGVQKIIYLGGLFDSKYDNHSAHIRSREEVGNILIKDSKGLYKL